MCAAVETAMTKNKLTVAETKTTLPNNGAYETSSFSVTDGFRYIYQKFRNPK